MENSKKHVLSLLMLMLVILSIGMVSASDVENATMVTDDSVAISSSASLDNDTVAVDSDYSNDVSAESDDLVADNDENIANNVVASSVSDEDVIVADGEAKTYTVTNETFFDYFPASGYIGNNIENGSTLIFKGEFSGLSDVSGAITSITIMDPTYEGDYSLNITGIDAVFKDISLTVTMVANTNISNLNIEMSNSSGMDSYALWVNQGTNVTISNCYINITGSNNKETYGIRVDSSDDTKLNGNTLIYTSYGNSSTKNLGVAIDDSANVELANNDLTFNIPSVAVGYNPTTYDAEIYSAGIFVSGSDNFALTENNITTLFNGKVDGSWDTLDGVYIKTSDNVVLSGNNISLKANLYGYALNIMHETQDDYSVVICDNFAVKDNVITTEAINAYGAQFVSNGTVEGNDITVTGKELAYGIYTEGSYTPISVSYENNDIYAIAHSALGISDGSVVSEILGNNITIDGNYTYGIYSNPPVSQQKAVAIKNNYIQSNGKGLGNTTPYYDEVIGVEIDRELADIQDNTIISAGNYTVNLGSNDGIIVTDNYLAASSLEGDASVYSTGTNTIENNSAFYDGIVYVSTVGADTNKGSIESPVATIAKAVEIATANGASHQIIILNGTYVENGISISDDLNITGQGNVVIDANGTRAFRIYSGNVLLDNLYFINGNESYSGSVIRVDAGSLTIKGSTFNKNGGTNRQALIYVNNADLTILDSVFENNTASPTGTSYGNIYVNNGNLFVNNSNFTNNHNKYGVFYIGGTNAQIYNSNFIANNATSSSAGTGAGLYIQGSSNVTIDNCAFVNNTANGGTSSYSAGNPGQGGALFIQNKANVVVSNTLFENNAALDSNGGTLSQGGAIFIRGGNLTVTDSVFKNNSASEGSEIYATYNSYSPAPKVTVSNSIILGKDDAELITIGDNNENMTVNVNQNWWGTNNPAGLVSDNVTLDNWVIMSLTTSPSSVTIGEEITVMADFNSYYDNVTKTINELTTVLPEELTVSFTANNGKFNKNNATTVDGVATVLFTVENQNTTIYATSSNAIVNITLNSEEPKVYNLTNATFFNFFDKNGVLLDSIVTGSTLNFIGEFGGLGVNSINITRELAINGVNATLNDISVNLLDDGINMTNFTIKIADLPEALVINANDVIVKNNFINITGAKDEDTYGIKIIDSDNVELLENTLIYFGNGNHETFNIGVEVSNSTDVQLDNNDFEISVPSVSVEYNLSTYDAIVHSAGVLVSGSDNFALTDNTINVLYNGNVDGAWDTIEGVYIKTSDNAVVSGNNISLKANEYGYALSVMYETLENYTVLICDNFTVKDNIITSEANDAYGAQFVSNGTVEGNDITATGKTLAYGIYTEGSYTPISVDYYNNTIAATAQSAVALSEGSVSSEIINNTLTADGNYTYGIYSNPPASQEKALVINNNTIYSNGSGLGDVFSFYDEVIGVEIERGLADIQDNTIISAGNYTVNLKNNNGIIVTDNYLVADSLLGDASVYSTGNNTIKDNTPDLKTAILTGDDVIMYYKNGSKYVVKLIDSTGAAVAGQNVTININGVNYTRTTDENGTAKLSINLNSGNYTVSVYYAGNENYTSAQTSNTVSVLGTIAGKDVTKIFRNGTQYYATFVDGQGKALANTNVTFNINGVMYYRTTDENGTAKLNINLNPGEYVLTAINNKTGEMISNNVTVLSSIISDDLVKYYKNGSQFFATILGADGNPVGEGENVSFNINGVLYTRQTNASGVAKLNINLNPGNYTVNTSYNGLNVANNIEVLSTVETEDISMTTASRVPFEAQILDAHGNPAAAGENVSFNINGVIYNKVTDANGIAKLNINLNPGKYTITTSYNGLNAANTVTVKQ